MNQSIHKHSIFLIAGLTLGLYTLTKLPPFSEFKVQLALLSIVSLVSYTLVTSRLDHPLKNSNLAYYLIVVTIMLVVGATGWFFSPFFFTLYLLGIFLSFIFSMGTSIAFVLVLVGLFSFNIGEVDPTYDFLVVLSLLTIIPLSFYLRKQYLKHQEEEKEILVLKQHQKFDSTVEEVLSNKINNFAVNLRQPINDLKLLGYRLKKLAASQSSRKQDLDVYSERIIIASEEALSMLRNFEEGTTGKKLLRTSDSEEVSNEASA